ncbi:carboxylesterase/lipase family protein [Actinocrispum wychmicini]|nr:carboxylesterase family protein [Actinocrispum wychmicini]
MSKALWTRGLVAIAAAAAATLAGAAGSAVASSNDSAVVWTDSGPLRGTVSPEYRTFQGIPYAAPPVGTLRWRLPEPPHPWSTPRDATTPGNRCAQGQSFSPPSYDEDCLYLNVTAPRGAGRKPVMVWLHGGGNSFGSGGEYDAHRLAVTGDAVVVTINYRLGLWASFGYPGLAGSGDFGLADQQAALKWVRRNAFAFGGDPSRVTIFGQSGGANDVCAQLTSPTARGLFQRAIMQSGTCATDWPLNGLTVDVPAGGPWLSKADTQRNGVILATKFGCTDASSAVDCMRAVSVPNLLADQAKVIDTPVAFGDGILPESPDKALAAGRYNRVPVISGTNRNEERLQAVFFPPPFDETQYQRLLAGAFGGQAPLVAAKYQSAQLGSPALAWAAVATDRVWTCRQLVDDSILARRTPTYAFEFADPQAPQPQLPFPTPFPLAAYHSAEMQYLFDIQGFGPLSPAQRQLAVQMIGYWTHFARTGNPNHPGLPPWPKFHDAATQSLAPTAIHQVDTGGEHNCAFWATIRS